MGLKEKIIWESLKLITLRGYLGTSIDDVMRAAKTSKGGFYNYFKSKEDLLLAVTAKAREIWRENNLEGLEKMMSPMAKVKKILENYRDRYIKDKKNLPGGCVFVTLSVELDDQRPELCREVSRGWGGFKHMIQGLLNEAKKAGELRENVNTKALTEMILAGLLGTIVIHGLEKSNSGVDRSINSLIAYLELLKT